MRVVTVLTVIVVALFTVAFTGQTEDTSTAVPKQPVTQQAERCKSARKAVVYYRNLTYHFQDQGEGGRATKSPVVRGKSCHWSRYAAEVWQARAPAAQATLRRWIERITLDDVPYCDGCNAWERTTDEVQAIFPGSKWWQMSCSSSEGGHGRWVVHGGGSYYPGAEYAKDGAEVGGNMQYTYGTFVSHFNAGVQYLIGKGYRLPKYLRGGASVRAWRSALGQAIASGAAYFLGLRGDHWSGAGC